MQRPQTYNLLGETVSALYPGHADGQSCPEMQLFGGPDACAVCTVHAAICLKSCTNGNPLMMGRAEIVLISEPSNTGFLEREPVRT